MPGRPGQRRVIPITKKSSIEFRFVGGTLNVEPRLEEKGTTWASCAIKNGTNKSNQPNFITRTMGTQNSVNLNMLGSINYAFGLSSAGLSYDISLSPPKSNNGLGQVTYKPKFTKFSPSCIDDKLKQKN